MPPTKTRESPGANGSPDDHPRLVRVIIDFETDPAGRPAGRLRTGAGGEEPFEDWLDLLRVLEACIDHSHDDQGVLAPDPTRPGGTES
jgi:hypothetical protein